MTCQEAENLLCSNRVDFTGSELEALLLHGHQCPECAAAWDAIIIDVKESPIVQELAAEYRKKLKRHVGRPESSCRLEVK